MKNVSILLAVICSLFYSSCSNERVNILSLIPDRFDPIYMYGNIKEVIVMSEYMSDTIKLDKAGRVTQKGHRHYSYDANGVLISKQAGHIKTEYVYDNNLLVATKCYRHNTLDDIYKYFYNDHNQIISMKWYRDNELKHEWRYEYNEDGNLLNEIELDYYVTNSIYNRLGYKVAPSKTCTIYSYDNESNIVKEEWYNNSELSRSTNFKYDKKGNIVYEEVLDYDDMEKFTTTYSYKYDRKGNWIKREETQNNETCVTTRNIIYY